MNKSTRLHADGAMPRRSTTSAGYRMDRLRIRHVRLLDVIHRRGSLGAAAKELALSQPAVTLMLRELEAVFGASLVDRDVRGGRLTAAGLRALERLNAALSGLEHAIDSSRSAGLEPPLRLGCAQVVGISVLPGALAYLERDAGVMPMQIVEGEAIALLKDLVAGRLDCVVAWMDESVSAQHSLDLFDITPLWKGRMQVVAAVGHPLVQVRNVPMDALIAAAWLMPRPGSRTSAAFLKLFVQNGFAPPPVAVECASIHTGMNIVAVTAMLTMTPDAVAGHYARQGKIAILQGKAIDLGDTHASLICLRENRDLSALVRLKKALLETVKIGSRQPVTAAAIRRHGHTTGI